MSVVVSSRNRLTSCGSGGVSEGLAVVGSSGGATGITTCFDLSMSNSVTPRQMRTATKVIPQMTKSLEKPALLNSCRLSVCLAVRVVRLRGRRS